ncbi:hypothetical protein Tco_0955317 [Tanacetum coccineum]|uniref:Transposase (Putative), gypsy type n=1 Tax=Tanacetum coccineum TaxID=301880 RepID=A0ABQ5E6Y4_9ASTR
MGRDTIKLETAVSTISQEYLLEFTSEYGISDDVHPELPGREDKIVDFLEGKQTSRKKHPPMLYKALRFPEKLEQPFLLVGRKSISYRRELASKRSKRWNASRRHVLRRRRGNIEYTPDSHPKTTRNPVMLKMDLFNLISAPNPAVVKTGTRPRTTHEVPLITVIVSRQIDMEESAATIESSGTPSTVERSPLDFANENPSQEITGGDGTEDQVRETVAPEIPPPQNASTTVVATNIVLEEEATTDAPLVSKRRRKRVNDGTDSSAPSKVLRKDFDASRPTQSTLGGKSIAATGLEAGSIFSVPASQETSIGIADSDPLFYAKPQLVPESSKGTDTEIPMEDIATTEADVQLSVGSLKSGKSTSPSVGGSPGGIYQPRWGVTNSCRLDTPEACRDMVDHSVPPRYFFELRHLPNSEFLDQYNMNLARQVAMGSQLRLRFEQEVRLLKEATTKIARHDQRIQAREKEITKLDEEIKSIRVMETEVHSLRNQTRNLKTLLEAEVDMKKQLSQQVFSLQCQISSEEKIKASFEEFKKLEDEKFKRRCTEMDARLDVLRIDFDEELYPHMLTAIAGRRWVIGHGLRLAVMKCAESTNLRQAFADVVSAGIVKGMSEGLRYGVEHREALKDLKYPLVDQLERLKDAPIDLLMASLHLKSDTGEDAPLFIHDLHPSSSQLKIPVYPEGLKILLVDAATQTEVSEDEGSPRLLSSKSLPPMFNLEWP